jgi:hypothetical protein
MRFAILALALIGLGGCSPSRASGSAPSQGAPPSGQWRPQPAPYPQAPPPPPQQPWGAPAAQPFPWPTSWQVPALPGGWPSLPGLPGWPGQGQPGLPSPPQPAPSNDIAQRCVDTINRYRATRSLPPLARWAANEPCATNEAALDAGTQRAHGSFGRCNETAQNACPNWPGPPERMIDECLKSMWDEGPGEFPAHGHYNNMADPRSTQVACGTTTLPNGSLWAVQDFR